MLDEKGLMLALKRHRDYSGMNEDVSHEIYHDDAVLEFPQSGERFEGWRTSGSGVGSTLLASRSTPAGSLTATIWWWSKTSSAMTAHHGCIPSTCLSSKATKWRMSAFTSWTGGKRRSGAHLGGPTRPRIHHHLRRRTAESDGDPQAGAG
jgi:hypothetical protein